MLEHVNKRLYAHSYANRPNMGTHKEVFASQKMMRQVVQGYYMQCDVSSYFTSIDKNILYKIINFHIEKINSANKNISKYQRLTIIEPYVLDNIVTTMKEVSLATKNIKKNKITPTILEEAIECIELSREFFMYFTLNNKLNYNQNFY